MRWKTGVNRPDLGGTVLNSAAVSRCPALLAINPDFTKLLFNTLHIHLPVLFAMLILTRCAAFRTVTSRVYIVCVHMRSILILTRAILHDANYQDIDS